jgi:hypothetical protein
VDDLDLAGGAPAGRLEPALHVPDDQGVDGIALPAAGDERAAAGEVEVQPERVGHVGDDVDARV